MKASLFAEDEDKDLFQDYGAIKLSSDVSSPRLIFPGSQSRPSGGKPLTVYLYIFPAVYPPLLLLILPTHKLQTFFDCGRYCLGYQPFLVDEMTRVSLQ